MKHCTPWILILAFGSIIQESSACSGSLPETLIWSDEFDDDSSGRPNDNIWSYDTGNGPSPNNDPKCSAHPRCAHLADSCCPTPIGVFLDCCDSAYGGWGNGELQNYTEESVEVINGTMQITVDRNETTGEFTSGRVKTEDKLFVKYGTIEARIRVPNVSDGLWPAFWTLGENFSLAGWPASGEIDIMEIGQGDAIREGVVNRRVISGAHWEHEGGYAAYARNLTVDYDLNLDFHYYKLEWTPQSLTSYVDCQQIWKMDINSTVCTDCEELHQHHFILLNIAVGGGFTSGSSSSSSGCGVSSPAGTFSHSGSHGGCGRTPDEITAPLPATMLIDWIRIYNNGFTEIIQPPTGEPTSSPTAQSSWQPTSSPTRQIITANPVFNIVMPPSASPTIDCPVATPGTPQANCSEQHGLGYEQDPNVELCPTNSVVCIGDGLDLEFALRDMMTNGGAPLFSDSLSCLVFGTSDSVIIHVQEFLPQQAYSFDVVGSNGTSYAITAININADNRSNTHYWNEGAVLATEVLLTPTNETNPSKLSHLDQVNICVTSCFKNPTEAPTANPTASPTTTPTSNPSVSPTISPTSIPSGSPTTSPTDSPSAASSTTSPTSSPTTPPTCASGGPAGSNPILADTDRKCGGNRLFRTPDNMPLTLEQCNQKCFETAGCEFFSLGEDTAVLPNNLAGVCIGCPKMPSAFHNGFNAYMVDPCTIPSTNSPTISPTKSPTASPSKQPSPSPSSTPTSSPTSSPSKAPFECPIVLDGVPSASCSEGTGLGFDQFKDSASCPGSSVACIGAGHFWEFAAGADLTFGGTPLLSGTLPCTVAGSTDIVDIHVQELIPSKSYKFKVTGSTTPPGYAIKAVSLRAADEAKFCSWPNGAARETEALLAPFTANNKLKPLSFVNICVERCDATPAPTHAPVATLAPFFTVVLPPSIAPTDRPTEPPTKPPTPSPTPAPTKQPTDWPTRKPTYWPTPTPTRKPTYWPSPIPTRKPTYWPTPTPTRKPTYWPTRKPTYWPSPNPTRKPTYWPTQKPTYWPTAKPTFKMISRTFPSKGGSKGKGGKKDGTGGKKDGKGKGGKGFFHWGKSKGKGGKGKGKK